MSSSEILLHRRPAASGEVPAPPSDANPEQGTAQVTSAGVHGDEAAVPPEASSPQQPRAFASDMSQIVDIGVCHLLLLDLTTCMLARMSAKRCVFHG